MIDLFNCMKNILKKVIAKQLFEFCKAYFKLNLGQIGAQKERLAIDAMTMFIEKLFFIDQSAHGESDLPIP